MNPLAFYQTCVQNWVNAVENAQANMLAFNQAVSTIQGYRARALGQWWQQAPNHLTSIFTAPSPSQALANLTLWQGQTCIQAAILGADTHATRAHLYKVWSRTFSTTTATSTCSTATTAPAPTPTGTGTSTTKAATTPATKTSTNAAPKSTTNTTTAETTSAATASPTQQPQATSTPTATETTTTQTTTQQTQPQQTAKVVKLSDVTQTTPQTSQSSSQQQTQATQAETQEEQPEQEETPPMVVNGSNGLPSHSSTATTFARNTGHALNASAAPRRTASLSARAGRRPR